MFDNPSVAKEITFFPLVILRSCGEMSFCVTSKTNEHFTVKLLQESMHSFSDIWWISLFKVRLSPSKKFIFIYFNGSPLKTMKNAFCFILKAPFVLDIFKFFSWLFRYKEKRLDKNVMANFKTLWRHRLDKKPLQYTFCPISQELKATRKWNLVS